MISPAFIKANYEVLKSLLRERKRQRRNEDLRTELEYFSEEYDEEREMEPRPTQVREAIPISQAASSRVQRQRERVIEIKDAPNREGSRVERNDEGGRSMGQRAEHNRSQGMNLPLLQAAHLGRSEHGPCDRKRDPDNFLHLFEGAIRMQKWAMPVACHMFTYTLKDSARIWWNGRKTGSILNYEDLKAKFRSHFSQQKKFTKTHLAVHNIKQKEGESTRAFCNLCGFSSLKMFYLVLCLLTFTVSVRTVPCYR
ncbi:reverse transcriptase domain-containing protein [Tanacetum coccineum]